MKYGGTCGIRTEVTKCPSHTPKGKGQRAMSPDPAVVEGIHSLLRFYGLQFADSYRGRLSLLTDDDIKSFESAYNRLYWAVDPRLRRANVAVESSFWPD